MAATRTQVGNVQGTLESVILRVRLRAERRAAWLAHLSKGFARAGGDTPDAEAEWLERSDSVKELNARLAQVERAFEGAAGARLRELQAIFQLSDPEMDLLQACAAASIDPGLGTVFADLQAPARAYLTEVLAARLFGYGRRPMWNSGCPLAMWRLVSAAEAAPGEPAALAADPMIVDWLGGVLRVDGALVGVAQLVEPRPPLENWAVEETVGIVRRAFQRETRVRLLLAGSASSGRRTFAAIVAARIGMQALALDTGEIADQDWADAFVRAQRLAVLWGTAPVWHGSRLDRSWPAHVVPAPVQFIAFEPGQAIGLCDLTADCRIDMPATTVAERRRLWKAHVPESAAWPAAELEALVARHELSVGEIAAASRRGPASASQAAAFARELFRDRLGDLARVLECPFTWDDLVVPQKLREALEDFAFEAGDRAGFWESLHARRLFPRGTGLVALFAGAPGTGKTMAAQIIAADLQLDLFRIDLAATISKYIGETAKHLSRIFARAARINALLLFDEADALFSKRTEVRDAHDRYANADTGYLLQLLEECQGIVVLATNKKQNIDSAFIRRVRYVFDFPRPDGDERRRIWRQVIGELSGPEALERLGSALDALAEDVELSGAQIKNAVLASIFVGRRSRERLAMTHLLRGVERELNKEGRSLSARERERWTRDA